MPDDKSPYISYFDCGGTYGYSFDVRHYVPAGMTIVEQSALWDAVEAYADAMADNGGDRSALDVRPLRDRIAVLLALPIQE